MTKEDCRGNRQGIEQPAYLDKSIVTEVTQLDKFYMAEDYHQEYFANNPNQPYCQAVVAAEGVKFRKHHLAMLKKQPA